MVDDALAARILAFARDAAAADFETLVLARFERQFATLPEYREHCESISVTPTSVKSWQEIPAIESARGPEAGVEAQADRELLPLALPELFEPSRLRLVVGSAAASDGAAPLLAALAHDAPPDSWIATERLDAKTLRSWLGARQRDRRPVSVISDGAGFERLVAVLERRAVRFRLPPGSEAFCAVSFEVANADLGRSWSEPLVPSLGLVPEACRRVLVGPEFSAPLLEHAAAPLGRYRLPHWVRAVPVDGERFAILDLAVLDAPPKLFGVGSGSLSFV